MKVIAAAVLAAVLGGAVWAVGAGGDPVPAPKAARPNPPAGVPPVAGAAAEAPRPYAPAGVLGDRLGKYVTIEGTPPERGWFESGTILVDTVDGKKLKEPVTIVVFGLELPTMNQRVLKLPGKTRYVLKGYESGNMIGTPGAVYEAAKEQGWKNVPLSQAVWHWRPCFVALIAVEPKGLELTREDTPRQ